MKETLMLVTALAYPSAYDNATKCEKLPTKMARPCPRRSNRLGLWSMPKHSTAWCGRSKMIDAKKMSAPHQPQTRSRRAQPRVSKARRLMKIQCSSARRRTRRKVSEKNVWLFNPRVIWKLNKREHERRDLLKHSVTFGSTARSSRWRMNSGRNCVVLAQRWDNADQRRWVAQDRMPNRRRGRIGICDPRSTSCAALKGVWQLRKGHSRSGHRKGQRLIGNQTTGPYF